MSIKRFPMFCCAALLCAATALVLAQPHVAGEKEASKSAPALERIKALEGDWNFADGDHKGQLGVTYDVTSGGHCVIERLFPGTDHEMITMYHLDGDKLMMTHYCAVGNNPRMHAEPDEAAQTVTFTCTGWSNMKSEEEGHMHAMTMTFIDDDHFAEEWTWQEKGKGGAEKFTFERKRD